MYLHLNTYIYIYMIRHVKLTCRGMSFNDWEKVIDTTAVSQTIGQSLQRSLIQKGAKNTSCPKTARPVSLPEGVSTNIPIFCWLNPFESLWNPTKPPWNPMKSEWNPIRPPKSCCLSAQALSDWEWLVNVGHGTSLRVKLPLGYPGSEAPVVSWRMGRWDDQD